MILEQISLYAKEPKAEKEQKYAQNSLRGIQFTLLLPL